MSGNYDERDVTFDIIEDIGVISVQETGWAKEINLVRWNGGVAKYDIRDWDPLHERMSKGITLHEDEMRRLLELMKHRRSRSRSRSSASDRSHAEPDTSFERTSPGAVPSDTNGESAGSGSDSRTGSDAAAVNTDAGDAGYAAAESGDDGAGADFAAESAGNSAAEDFNEGEDICIPDVTAEGNQSTLQGSASF